MSGWMGGEIAGIGRENKYHHDGASHGVVTAGDIRIRSSR